MFLQIQLSYYPKIESKTAISRDFFKIYALNLKLRSFCKGRLRDLRTVPSRPSHGAAARTFALCKLPIVKTAKLNRYFVKAKTARLSDQISGFISGKYAIESGTGAHRADKRKRAARRIECAAHVLL